MNASANSLVLQATTHASLSTLLPDLKAELHFAGIWIWESDRTSDTAADLHLELHAHTAHFFYTSLVRCGLHLSRSAHLTLASLCSHRYPFATGVTALKLEIRFMAPSPHLHQRISAISA